MGEPHRLAVPVAAAALLLLAACGGDPKKPSAAPSASPTPTASSSFSAPSAPALKPDPRFQMPRAAQCYRMAADRLGAEVASGTQVPCSKEHTTVVAYAGLVRPAITEKTPQRKRMQVARQTCLPAFKKAAGGNADARAMTLLGWTMFTPSREQLARGARWVRCEVFALSGKQLVSLPERLPLISGGIPEALRICQGGNGADISCAQSHVFRVEAVFRAPDGPYPGADFRATARDRCDQLMGKGGYWQPPSQAGWTAGDRYVRCLSRK